MFDGQAADGTARDKPAVFFADLAFRGQLPPSASHTTTNRFEAPRNNAFAAEALEHSRSSRGTSTGYSGRGKPGDSSMEGGPEEGPAASSIEGGFAAACSMEDKTTIAIQSIRQMGTE